ncbi:hypothetical protein CYY_003155 [Polysphondylium violaceum]|uniref:DNA replication complex GINS protein PSF2 n=1 Tax=Polysphondylium violaceum TaxID=133409 RepID=A0A8J4PYX8_9MYCE|nr:hypothetical protein CYY_003155 [Polysphondylium violaceum]
MNEVSLHPNQIEFLAEDSTITIIPNFKMGSLLFLSGEYGPFVPSIPIDVPLWLAISLKKKKKCTIKPPKWMNYEYLNEKYQEENKTTTKFVEMPQHFIEISSLLLSTAAEEIPNANVVSGLIEDIVKRRQSKINHSFQEMLTSVTEEETIPVLEMKDLTLMEINRIRGSLVTGLAHLYKIKLSSKADGDNSTSNSSLSTPSFTQSQSQK